MYKLLSILILNVLLVGCSKQSDEHRYTITGVVSEVISCEKSICRAWVKKSDNDRIAEIWLIDAKVKAGSQVSKSCSFTIVSIEDEDKSAGLGSSAPISPLNNNNCSEIAQVN